MCSYIFGIIWEIIASQRGLIKKLRLSSSMLLVSALEFVGIGTFLRWNTLLIYVGFLKGEISKL